MPLQTRFAALLSSIVFFCLVCSGATITGTIKGTEGAPFQGAFVEAQNTKTRITVIVLSDTHGRYQIDNLPAGDYRLSIRAVGFRADPRMGVNLTADQNASFDFALQAGTVRWSDISLYQGNSFSQRGKGKTSFFQNLLDLPFLSKPHGSRNARCRWMGGPCGLHAERHELRACVATE